MSTIYLTRGLPGSGKSTFAFVWLADDPENRVRVSRDDLRAMLGIDTGVGTQEQERTIGDIERAMVAAAVKAEKDVIVDATNLNTRFVKEFFKLGRVDFVDFPIPVDQAIDRDYERGMSGGRYVGKGVIQMLARRYNIPHNGTLPPPPLQPEPFDFKPAPAYDPDLPDAIIVDIDGTLANYEPHRGPHDTSKYHLDTPHGDVIETVNKLKGAGYDVLVTSGRDAAFFDVTRAWLRVQHVGMDRLIMRPEGDRRKDAIVKHDLYHEHIAGKYNVIMVFDDRQRVVDMWRAIGLTCAQVNYGDF